MVFTEGGTMPRFGDRCRRCGKGLTRWVGALIGGAQVYECPDCGHLQTGYDLKEEKKKP
jgi:hypothetical protein